MGWLRRILGREKQSHDQWLADHPDKNAAKYVPASITPDEEQRMRETMERELDEARAAREK
ncbi:MAG: hypothetical protein M0R74_05005 [Dehalococcoidia bacterium]|nr:hypothetical protein [Dehalococcoidia bacterium]